MITKQNIGGETLYCVSEKPAEILGAFPTLAEAATVQRFILGANMSNDAMAFAVHCMQESEQRTAQAGALLWADELLKGMPAADAATRPPVKRRKKKKKPATQPENKPAADAQKAAQPAAGKKESTAPAAVAPAGSGPAAADKGGKANAAAN